ncbi:hypothetical protein Ssi03_74490 [Sphaerisporangium siamense]|uniref:Uncharacterized protein n=1 Tax=Sphaerisporangium siamense TaxID=795645 RepID=A0A7W7D924_9ACTN|nr:hypothetical protein [Sphaerisporangium siamense]MBB4702301.1 hypothetical protein [Sphaerisporangium siamense]GII89459.1 hypothetical protein Ssi03_74490 [Sphaerisporangium siamense]
MGLIRNKGQSPQERKAAVQAYKQAREALEANTDRDETDEYLQLNSEVAKAEKNIPWIYR